MREILFKAKRLDNGEWVEGYFTMNQSNGNAYITSNVSGCAHPDLVDYSTLCQYIGLKDKNGNKIFEGDTIKFSTWEGALKERAVRWDEEHNRFCVWLNGATTLGVNRYLSNIEVIGNIHDKEEINA